MNEREQDLNPHGPQVKTVIQAEPAGCFGAAAEAVTGVDQADINKALVGEGIYFPAQGFSPTPAQYLTEGLEDVGITATEVLPVPQFGVENDPSVDASDQAVTDRLNALYNALKNGESAGPVILFGKRERDGQDPFLHAVVVERAVDLSAEQETEFDVMDPSEVDGGRKTLTTDEMVAFLTPDQERGIAIFAYQLRAA